MLMSNSFDQSQHKTKFGEMFSARVLQEKKAGKSIYREAK
jgi:hypothetical protein